MYASTCKCNIRLLRLILKIYTVYYHYKWPNLKKKIVLYFCLMQKEEKENSKIMHCAVKLKDYFFPQTWARVHSFVCRLKSKLNLSTNLFQSYFILST